MSFENPEADLTPAQAKLVRRMAKTFRHKGFLFTCPCNNEDPKMAGVTHIVFSDPVSLFYLYESMKTFVEPMMKRYEEARRRRN